MKGSVARRYLSFRDNDAAVGVLDGDRLEETLKKQTHRHEFESIAGGCEEDW
jgi:hypothetical protein